jgi:hypothetical protein
MLLKTCHGLRVPFLFGFFVDHIPPSPSQGTRCPEVLWTTYRDVSSCFLLTPGHALSVNRGKCHIPARGELGVVLVLTAGGDGAL